MFFDIRLFFNKQNLKFYFFCIRFVQLLSLYSVHFIDLIRKLTLFMNQKSNISQETVLKL